MKKNITGKICSVVLAMLLVAGSAQPGMASWTVKTSAGGNVSTDISAPETRLEVVAAKMVVSIASDEDTKIETGEGQSETGEEIKSDETVKSDNDGDMGREPGLETDDESASEASGLETEGNETGSNASGLEADGGEVGNSASGSETDDGETGSGASGSETDGDEAGNSASGSETGSEESRNQEPAEETEDEESAKDAPGLKTDEEESVSGASMPDIGEEENASGASVPDIGGEESVSGTPTPDIEAEESVNGESEGTDAEKTENSLFTPQEQAAEAKAGENAEQTDTIPYETEMDIIAAEGLKLTFPDVTLSSTGDWAEYSITVKNTGDTAVLLSGYQLPQLAESFTVSGEMINSEGEEFETGSELVPGDTCTFTFRVQLAGDYEGSGETVSGDLDYTIEYAAAGISVEIEAAPAAKYEKYTAKEEVR